MSLRHAIAALLFTGAAPALLPAQWAPLETRGGRGYSFQLSDGEPISFFLEYSRELELSDSQKVSLMNIRRRLREQDAPFMQQMDSLRNAMGISLDPTPRLTNDKMEQLRRFQAASKPMADSLKVYNDAARDEARRLLLPDQLVRLDSLAKEAARGRAGRDGRPPSGAPR